MLSMYQIFYFIIFNPEQPYEVEGWCYYLQVSEDFTEARRT